MSQVVRLDKISYPFPQTILGVDNNGNSVEIENGKFVTLLPQLLDYDVIPGVNVIDAERGIVALHHTPPVPKPTKELEKDFLLQEEKYGRAYILSIGDIVTIAGTNIENESGFKIGAELGVSANGDIQIGKGQAIPFKLRALGTTSLEGVKAVVLRVEESAMSASNLDVDSLTLGSYVFTYNANDDTLDVSYNGIEKVFVINKDQSIQANSIEAKE